jgi:RNA polymerase sigma-70 factor (ECF subfamily)
VPSGIQAAQGDEVMDVRSQEPELRALILAGLDGDLAAHKILLARLSVYLRAYFRGQLARIGRGPADAEDLLQETLIALHTRRHTYDRSQPLTPWVYAIARYRLVGEAATRSGMSVHRGLKALSPRRQGSGA